MVNRRVYSCEREIAPKSIFLGEAMIRIRSAVLGAAMIIGVSVTASAQQGSNSNSEAGTTTSRRGDASRMLFRDINLSESQQTQVKTIREKYAVQARSARDSARAKRELSQQGDTTRARGANKASRKGQRYSGQHMQKAHTEIRTVLTSEQQPIFDRNIAEMKQKHEQKSKRKGKEGGRNRG